MNPEQPEKNNNQTEENPSLAAKKAREAMKAAYFDALEQKLEETKKAAKKNRPKKDK